MILILSCCVVVVKCFDNVGISDHQWALGQMVFRPLTRFGWRVRSWIQLDSCVSCLQFWILKWFLVDCVESRYLKEDKPHGSAGGLYYFRDMIMEDSPVWILILFINLFCNIFFWFLSWEILLFSVTLKVLWFTNIVLISII